MRSGAWSGVGTAALSVSPGGQAELRYLATRTWNGGDELAGPPDVRFDHGAAAEASAACRTVADRLAAVTDERVRVGHATREAWSGPEAVSFDGLLRSEVTGAGEIIEALRRLAGSIDQAADTARTEQHRRERVRAELAAEAERQRRAAEQRAVEQGAGR